LEGYPAPITKSVRLLRIKLSQPRILLGIFLLSLLAYLILYPIITLVINASSFQLMDSFRLSGANEGEFTLYYWKKMFSNYAIFIRPFLNTLFVGIGTAGITAVIGVLLAWLVFRTNIPLKGLISVLAVLPYLLPSFALAMPWIEIFRNTGMNLPPGFLEYITGLRAPSWLVFGPVPIIIVLGLHYFPFTFLLVGSALRNINSEIEETAELLGASRFTILRTITIPIVMPALLSALILSFSRAIGSFGTPSLLGLPAKFNLLSVQIRSLMMLNSNSEAFVLAIMLIAFCTLVIYLNNRVIGLRKGFDIIGGKGVRQRLTPLGKLRIPVSISIIFLLSIAVILPLGLLIWTSFMSNLGDYSVGNFSLQYWFGVVDPKDPEYITGDPGVFRNPMFFLSIKNTLLVSGLGAVITGVIGMLVGYVVVRGRGKSLSALLERISFAPIMIPSIAFGATYISLFGVSRGPIPALYGTLAIMILVVIGKQMPYTSRSGISAMHQLSGELEEAGEILGGGWLKRFRQIIWPLTRSGFSAGFMLVFITTTRELSLFILLVTSKTLVITALIFDQATYGTRQLSYALMTTLITLSFIMVGIYRLYERHSKKALIEKGIV
jgi:iron(III) transport system permease protein